MSLFFQSSSNAAPTTVGDKFLVQVRDGNMEQIRKTLDQNPEVINFSNSYGVTGQYNCVANSLF